MAWAVNRMPPCDAARLSSRRCVAFTRTAQRIRGVQGEACGNFRMEAFRCRKPTFPGAREVGLRHRSGVLRPEPLDYDCTNSLCSPVEHCATHTTGLEFRNIL